MRTLWWSRRAITLHVALVVAVPLFLTLGAWQLSRALQGNLLSWAYTFEWPFFAGYATWMWWRLVHEETASPADLVPAAARRHAGSRSVEGEPDGPCPGGASALAAVSGTSETSESRRVTDDGGRVAKGASLSAPRIDYDPFDDEADPELAAYNRYLAGLHAEHPER
jgi:hypothetical protein